MEVLHLLNELAAAQADLLEAQERPRWTCSVQTSERLYAELEALEVVVPVGMVGGKEVAEFSGNSCPAVPRTVWF